MQQLLAQSFLTSLIFGAVTSGVPLLLAALGEQISEKAGVLNIGIEGMMLFGAYTGFAIAYYSGSFALGFLSGGLGGMAVAAVVMLLGVQCSTALLYFSQFSRPYPRLARDPAWLLPGLSHIPVLGAGLFSHDPLVYLSVLLVPAATLLFRSSHIGLNLEAAGNAPAA